MTFLYRCPSHHPTTGTTLLLQLTARGCTVLPRPLILAARVCVTSRLPPVERPGQHSVVGVPFFEGLSSPFSPVTMEFIRLFPPRSGPGRPSRPPRLSFPSSPSLCPSCLIPFSSHLSPSSPLALSLQMRNDASIGPSGRRGCHHQCHPPGHAP